ncbi:hypothetical protein TrLO_g11170 [Triparma laevis f. longispina]|uniref:Kinesin-like protein n=1 Tax=Triparma laevis f. longispina TaxID=1714387 RepID=A0A9W7FE82_9STRA|nr:hypothetical protein TrLO_g11170 [Triparma laevis f. longispina]
MLGSARQDDNLMSMAFEGGGPAHATGQAQVSPELFKQGVLEHAVWLGMDPERDKKFLWIAERSLVAPLPQDWQQLKTAEDGHPYYYNEVTQESRWDHPSDNEYRELFKKKKEEAARSSQGAMSQGAMSPSSPRHNVNTSLSMSMSPGSVNDSRDMSTFSINTPPIPPRSPDGGDSAGSGETSKLLRQRERIIGERDTAVQLNEQLKAEIEEEMERANKLHKKCSEAEAKLSACQRQIKRLQNGTGGGGEGGGGVIDVNAALEDELIASQSLVKSLTEEVTKLKTDPKRRLPPKGGGSTVKTIVVDNHPTDLQETLVLFDTTFEQSIKDLDTLAPKYGDEEVKAMVSEVEMMCQGYRKVLKMPELSVRVGGRGGEEKVEEEKEERKVEEKEGEEGGGGSNPKLASLEAELVEMKKKNMVLNRKLSELEEEIEELNAKREEVEGEAGRGRKQLEQEKEDEIERLKVEMERGREESEETMRELKGKIGELNGALETLSSSNMSKENRDSSQLSEFKDKLSVTLKKFDDAKDKYNKLNKEKAELERENKALNSSINDIDHELKQAVMKLQDTKVDLKSKEDEYESMRGELGKELEGERKLRGEELGKLREMMKEKVEKEEKLKGEMGELTEELVAVKREFELTKDDLEESKQEAKTAWKKWDKAVEDVEKVKVLNQKMEFTRDEALREVEELKERIERLEVEGKAYRDKSEEWEGKYGENQRKIKKLNEHIVTLQGNIRVFCRLRPLSKKEEEEVENDPEAPSMEKSIQHLDDGKMLFHGAMYEYDHVFTPNTNQSEVFNEVQSAVSSSMEGYRVCIFAYGQTGSGKTHTMEGPRRDRGVNFRALEEMFEIAKSDNVKTYTFRVSVLEVYNETVCDLLTQGKAGEGTDLAIRMRKDQVFVEGLTECEVESTDDVEELMQLASSNRSTASNNVNEHSSRSHLVLSVKVGGTNKSNGTVINGKLNLIDLAGSERLKNTSASGQRLKEAQNINKSLSALGDVVNALGKEKAGHVPYRNSKLTFLLQDSLRSSAKVLMFVNINPAPKSAGESICSLNFAARCRAVQLGKARRQSIVVKGVD